MTYCLPKDKPDFVEAVKTSYAGWKDKLPANTSQ
jgi:hypothetical protein